ncbi:MAG: helix-turn-helix domain-containing protein [Candidatus Oleimicrobiaceae bacterium]
MDSAPISYQTEEGMGKGLVERRPGGWLPHGTVDLVSRVIEREFGVRYHPRYVWHILTGMGWSARKPERRAREGDEEAVAAWRTEGWIRVKSLATEAGLSC